MIRRRDLVLGLGASWAAALACSRKERVTSTIAAAPSTPAAAAPPPIDAGPPRGATKLVTWSFDERGATGQVAVLVPAWGDAAARYPVLVALHGRGEAVKPPAEGMMGWPRDYALVRAIQRVCAPPITADDLEGFAEPEQLDAINAQLRARPFGGLVVVCPYVPDLNLQRNGDIADYGKYLRSVVLPRVARELPALSAPESTGIDGVSLGGVVSLRVGLASPDVFGAVGALQPAIGEDQATELTELARAAIARRPSLKLRLTTSHDDYYRAAVVRLDDAWRAAGVPHDFAELPGPHDYPFNRGPGAIEMLLWHDRVLAR